MTIAEPPVKTIELHAAQTKLFESDRRFVAGVAGTGGGKTYLGPLWLAKQIAEHPGCKWLAVGPTYDLLKMQTRPTLIDMFTGTDFEGVLHKADNEYHLPDGGVIHFRSADRPERLESIHAHGAWLDEAGQMSYAVWVAIQARLGLYQGPCLITTTFYPKHRWIKREWYDRFTKGDPDYLVVQWRSIDNPAYPVAEYERARRTLDPATFGARYAGQFTELRGMVYPSFATCLIDRAEMPEGWQNWDKYGGIDFGYHNPFVALNAVRSPDDVLYVYEEHYRAEMLLNEHAKRLRPGTQYFADPSAKQDIEELKALIKQPGKDLRGCRIEGGINDIAVGIEKVNGRVRTGRLKVCRCCPNLIDEADGYVYDDREDRVGPEKPVKENDHCMDALRYLVMGIDGASGVPRTTFEVWDFGDD
jgi:phage terminase large subunit